MKSTNMREANPSNIYALMLEVKAGSRGCFAVTKKECKAANVPWSFVENSASILGLNLKRDGNSGYLVSRLS